MKGRPRFRFVTIALGVALFGFLAACGDDDDVEVPAPPEPASLEVTAVDIDYVEDTLEMVAGPAEITLVNEGDLDHTFVIEGLEGQLRLEAAPGETDTGSIELEAGEYAYYCDVPGHRDTGQEGVLTVS